MYYILLSKIRICEMEIIGNGGENWGLRWLSGTQGAGWMRRWVAVQGSRGGYPGSRGIKMGRNIKLMNEY